jgi:ribokinase
VLTVESYPVAVAMCFVTMVCWGSWANTQKLATQKWRFQLFYWDYTLGVFILALVFAFTLGSSGRGGRGFLVDLAQADAHWLGSAFLGGVIFNLANILLVAAIDMAGMAVAFPVGIGLALVLGVGCVMSRVVRDRRAASGVALICVAQDGENSIAVAAGANARLSLADVRNAAAVQLAAKAGVTVLVNPAPAQPLPNRLLELISILTPNQTEAERLTGIKVTDDAAAARASAKLRSRGVGTVILTLGARGAFISNADGQQRIPGFKVKALDSTGAGDVFNGALSVALTENKSLGDAVRFICAAAALSVTRLGAQPSAPTRVQIERFLRDNR